MQQPPSQSAGGAGSELRSDAQQIGSKAANRLHSEVDARKGTAATQAKSVSTALQRAAGDLDEGAPTWLKSAFQQGAEQVQRFADTLERKDSRQMLNEVQSFARERPALFLGACAAAGFAAARIFKAGGEAQSGSQYAGGTEEWDQSQPWGDGESDSSRGQSFGQQFDEGGRGGSSQPFMAGSDTATQSRGSTGDELSLGSGGEGGTRIASEGDYR